MAIVIPTPAHMIDHPSERYVKGLATAVEGALWNFGPIRQSNTLINVEAEDGVVTLTGNIRGDMLYSMANHIVRGVPGVVRVINELVSDSRIESDAAIAVAMAPDVELTTDRLSIKSYLGSLHLSGIVADPEMAVAEAKVARITELVAAVTGVREVENHLHAVEGSGDDAYVVEAVEEEVVEKVVGARAMGTLLSEAQRDKVRAMIQARAASIAG
jgi:osmotically-inducible protein OsmY